MTDTRGPAPGKVPPHVKERLEEKRRRAARRAERGPVWLRPPALAAAAVVVALIGLAIGLGLSGDPEQAAADTLVSDVLPVANRAEALWRTGLGDVGAIADAAAALETANDTSGIEQHHDAWVQEHQRILDELDELDLDPIAQAVRDLYRASVRAQLDAVVQLGAAVAHEGSARTELLRASIREIGRSRALLRDARLALEALGGPATPAVDVPTVPGLTAPDAPLPDPLPGVPVGSEPPTDDSSEDDAGAEGAESADDGADDGASAEPTDEPTEPAATASPS